MECQLNGCDSGSCFETHITLFVGLGFVVVGILSGKSGYSL